MLFEAEIDDISGLLWSDDSVLQWKHEKTVGVLMALGKLFETATERTDCETEFLRLLRWCELAAEEPFELLFCDPRAYHWARVAFDLVASVHRGASLSNGTREYVRDLGMSDLAAALAYHLNQFSVFVASLAVCSQTPIAFSPVRLDIPAFLPGTVFSISHPSSQVSLRGVEADGTLMLSVDGADVLCPTRNPPEQLECGATLHVAPQVDCGQGRITLQPHAFNVPGLKDIRSVSSAQVKDQYAVVETLEETLRLIRAFGPEIHHQMGRYLRTIAFKSPGAGGIFNTSCSRLPGASIFTASPHPLVLADDLIHEFHHNRLFALEEKFAFLTEDLSQSRPTTFYSPWRDDPRPIYGLFHAAFVFERVHAFSIAAIVSGQLNEMDRAYASSRAARLAIQLQITLAQLLCWGNFSGEGRAICEAISESLKRDLATAEGLGIGWETPLVQFDPQTGYQITADETGEAETVRGSLIQHIRECDVNHRTEQVVKDHFEQVSDFATAMAELV